MSFKLYAPSLIHEYTILIKIPTQTFGDYCIGSRTQYTDTALPQMLVKKVCIFCLSIERVNQNFNSQRFVFIFYNQHSFVTDRYYNNISRFCFGNLYKFTPICRYWNIYHNIQFKLNNVTVTQLYVTQMPTVQFRANCFYSIKSSKRQRLRTCNWLYDVSIRCSVTWLNVIISFTINEFFLLGLSTFFQIKHHSFTK
jgi:hypothetical protein